MPRKLFKYLPQVPEADREELFGSIMNVMMYPPGDPIREGVIDGTPFSHFACKLRSNLWKPLAYDDVMKIICIVATCISVLPLICNLFMKDYFLGDKQNAVDALDLRGELSIDASPSVTEGEEKKY